MVDDHEHCDGDSNDGHDDGDDDAFESESYVECKLYDLGMMMATMLPLKVKVVQIVNYIWAVLLLPCTAYILTNVMMMTTMMMMMKAIMMIMIIMILMKFFDSFVTQNVQLASFNLSRQLSSFCPSLILHPGLGDKYEPDVIIIISKIVKIACDIYANR